MCLPVLPLPRLHELEARSGLKTRLQRGCACGLLVPCPSGWMGAGFHLLFALNPATKGWSCKPRGEVLPKFVRALVSFPKDAREEAPDKDKTRVSCLCVLTAGAIQVKPNSKRENGEWQQDWKLSVRQRGPAQTPLGGKARVSEGLTPGHERANR